MLLGSWPALAYTLLFTLFPIVVMSMLGEKQLEKEQYTRKIRDIQFCAVLL